MDRKARDSQRKLKTRQRLLDAAAATFVRHGYHNTLISQIVADADVGQGTFYRYFVDKRDVFSTLMAEFFQQVLAQFDPMSQTLPTNVAEYEAASLSAINKSATILEEHFALARLFIREGPAIDEAFAREMDGYYTAFAGLAKHFLEHAIAAGFARSCDPDVVSQCLIGMGLRLIDNAWGEGMLQDRPKQEIIEKAVDFAFRGMGRFDADDA